MKILFIITDYGSFNNFLAELSISLSKENKIHVICSNSNIIKIIDKFDYNKYNLTFHTVDIPRKTSIINIINSGISIRKIIKIIKPQLVYAHFTTGIFPTILFKNRNIEYWGTFHGLGLNASKGVRKIIFTIVEMYCLIRLDKRFLINEKDYFFVQKIFNTNTFKYKSYGVGCDIVKFDKNKYSEYDKLILKQKLGIENKFVITYTGRFVEFKGFDIVYNSFVELHKYYKNKVVLILIGGVDSIHPTGLLSEQEIDIDQNKNILNVGFTSEVDKYLSISDVFLFPSKKEGLPVCILEALSMGIPVITLDERGNSDLIKNDFNGYLIKSESKKEIINKILEKLILLHKNKSKLKLMSNNCLEKRNLYSRLYFVEEQLKLINEFKKNEKKKI